MRKVTETLTPKTGNREPQQNYCIGMVSNELPRVALNALRRQPHPQFLKWYKTFSWLFGSRDNSNPSMIHHGKQITRTLML